jgi:S-adenosylmethionine-diacylglycerol 3-amino-3-carboxypropyl transferase
MASSPSHNRASTRMPASSSRKVAEAMVRHEQLSSAGLLERAFAFAFRGLVYAQIWEDPVVDMEAMAITPESDIIAIASGGCNILSYLTADPRSITALDLNTAHIALNRLKLAAARNLPTHGDFHRFFAQAGRAENVAAYKTHVRPHLDEVSRRYWERRDLTGRRRIRAFTRNFYANGLLGKFIGGAHLIAKLYKVDPRELLAANSIDEQRQIFETRFAPIFDRKLVRWLTQQPASLFGLGIPPAQYDALCEGEARTMADVLRQRLEKLACDFDISGNYFAWQAFGRGYGDAPLAPLPPYLQPDNHEAVASRTARVSVLHRNYTEHLRASAPGSFDRYVLLDAQDWMSDAQLTDLWTQITRTARPGARVIFRTAAEPSLLPGRIPDQLLDAWTYEAEQSADFTRRDRSAIYGGFHLYVLRDGR